MAKNPLIETSLSGPELLTGGSFGAEGGIISITISLVFIVLLLLMKWPKADPLRMELWQKYPVDFGVKPVSGIHEPAGHESKLTR